MTIQSTIDALRARPGSGDTIAVIDPVTEEQFAEFADEGVAGVDAAVARARASFESGVWQHLPQSERAKVLWRVADLIEARTAELARLVRQKNSRPNHPTTCGKVERFQQTMKRWLRAQPTPTTIGELQTQLDEFVDYYNHHRPHRSLPHRATPATAYTARPKASPGHEHTDTEFRVRHDRVACGNVSLRVDGDLHHIGLGRTLDGTRVILLIDHYDIRVIHAATGEIIRALTINPERRYHGTGKPPGGPKGPRKMNRTGP